MRAMLTMATILAMSGPVGILVADKPAATSAPAATSQVSGVNDTYPGLASSGLIHARLSDLPKGTLLKAGELTISEKDVADQIAKAPQPIQDQLKKNAFFLLEQIAAQKLLLAEAKRELAEAGKDISGKSDRDVTEDYLKLLTREVTVTEGEIAQFYDENRDMFGGAGLGRSKPQIAQYLLREKKQQAVREHVKTLAKRTTVEVSADWARAQSVLAKDNPVDKVRSSGRPSLVDFGSKGCRPCDMLAPILETLKKKHDGKANVLFVSVQEHQILAARYGVQSIPVQIFFDKDGKEVFRHVGFFAQAKIEKKLAEMGVK